MMGKIPGNPYVVEAEEQYEYVGESWQSHEGITDATMMAAAIHTQALATLALAYEQRTANLIAAATATFADGSAMFPPISDSRREEIAKRLVKVKR